MKAFISWISRLLIGASSSSNFSHQLGKTRSTTVGLASWIQSLRKRTENADFRPIFHDSRPPRRFCARPGTWSSVATSRESSRTVSPGCACISQLSPVIFVTETSSAIAFSHCLPLFTALKWSFYIVLHRFTCSQSSSTAVSRLFRRF